MPAGAKQLLRDVIEQLPDDASVEDAMERLYFLAKVSRGLEAAERGELISHDEIQREFLPEE